MSVIIIKSIRLLNILLHSDVFLCHLILGRRGDKFDYGTQLLEITGHLVQTLRQPGKIPDTEVARQ